MAAGAWKWFGAGLLSTATGGINLNTTPGDHFRMVLVTSSWTPAQTTDATWTTLSSNEVANGGGYTTHGKTLTVTTTRTGLVVKFSVDDQSWTTSTITAKYAVIVKDADNNGALASTDALLCYCDLETGGGSVSTTNGTFAITIAAGGALTITAA